MEREREIRAFNPEESWKITALLEKDKNTLSVELTKIGGKGVKFKTEEEAKRFFASHNIQETSLLEQKDKK